MSSNRESQLQNQKFLVHKPRTSIFDLLMIRRCVYLANGLLNVAYSGLVLQFDRKSFFDKAHIFIDGSSDKFPNLTLIDSFRQAIDRQQLLGVDRRIVTLNPGDFRMGHLKSTAHHAGFALKHHTLPELEFL